MKYLLKAIKDHFDSAGGASLRAIVGDSGLYYDQAPQGTSMPYVTCHIISYIPERSIMPGGQRVTNNILLQFSVWSDSRSVSEVSNIYGYLDSLFDRASLTIDGFEHIVFIRETAHAPFYYDNAWNLAVDYRWLAQRAGGYGEGGYGEGGYGEGGFG